MIRQVLALSALLTVGGAGCDKKEAAPAETPSAAAPVAAAPVVPATPVEPVVDVASLPVEEQYEADAEKEITSDNLTAKLDELEKEISAP